MYTSIGATCTMHDRELTRDTSDCHLHCPLYCWAIALSLSLKAMIISAIILNAARNVHAIGNKGNAMYCIPYSLRLLVLIPLTFLASLCILKPTESRLVSDVAIGPFEDTALDKSNLRYVSRIAFALT